MASCKNGIAVFCHQPWNCRRNAIRSKAGHHFTQTLWSLRQLCCRIGADIVERIEFERKEIERHSGASNAFEKPIHPGTIARCIRPCEKLAVEVLQAWSSEFQMRIHRSKPASDSGVKCGIILRRRPLTVGFLDYLASV